MTRYTLSALAAALALAGCDSTPADTVATAESTDAAMDSGAMAGPAATETVVVPTDGTMVTTDADGTNVTVGAGGTPVRIDGDDVDASVGPDGATATAAPDR